MFVFKACISGTVSAAGHRHSNSQGLAGIKLLLEDSDGNVLATTRTDSQGHYQFTQLSGTAADPTLESGVSATGNYKVVLVLPAGATQISADPGLISITRGSTNIQDIDFVLGQM